MILSTWLPFLRCVMEWKTHKNKNTTIWASTVVFTEKKTEGFLLAANLSQGGLMLTYAESDFVCARQTAVTNKINSH